MPAEKPRTSTASAGEEQKEAGEERKEAGEERKDDGIMQRISRLPLPGAGLAPAMPAGVPGRVLWWGGLAALAAFDVVEWPVALVVGAGEWVAEQYAKAEAQRPGNEPWRTATQTPSSGG